MGDGTLSPAAGGEGGVAVSVLVPVRNEADGILAAVAEMLAQQVEGSMEILLADGNSTDGTPELLDALAAQDDRVRVLNNPLSATPSGLNLCLRHARGKFVARMDAHTIYPSNYLQAGITRLERGGTDWVSGPTVPDARGRVSQAVSLALDGWLGRGNSRKWAKEPAADGAQEEFELDTGVFSGVWRRDKLLELGGWDERWVRNQDSEMAARFIEQGARLVCLPEMAAHYRPRDSMRALARQYVEYGYYRAATAQRHPHSMRRSQLLPPLLVLTTSAAVVAPRPVRRAARFALTLYGAALVAGAADASRKAPPETAAMLVPVIAVMHFAHAIGFLARVCERGVPWRTLMHLAGFDGTDTNWAPEPVYAPSLRPSTVLEDR